jgi:hypothetical protein
VLSILRRRGSQSPSPSPADVPDQDVGRRVEYVIAGAIVGVLGVLALLFALVRSADDHYVTRREYDQLRHQLDRIERKVDNISP